MRGLAAVTGGTGFLGRAITRALRDAGWRVRLLARSPVSHPQLDTSTFEQVRGDLSSPDALRRLVEGADAIVHAAGLVKALSRREFMAVNARGCEAVATAAAAHAPTARLLLVSSMAAREPKLSPYAASKRAGEDLLVSAYADKTWLVVRPPAIYGPWDDALLPLFQSFRLPIVPIFAPSGARVAVIHVRDAAEAVAALCAEGPSQCMLDLSDHRPEGYGWRDILAHAAVALGVTRSFVPLPGGLLVAAAAGSEALARLRGKPAMLCIGKAREMLHPDWSADPSSMPPGHVWLPKIGLADGLAETVSWYRAARWL